VEPELARVARGRAEGRRGRPEHDLAEHDPGLDLATGAGFGEVRQPDRTRLVDREGLRRGHYVRLRVLSVPTLGPIPAVVGPEPDPGEHDQDADGPAKCVPRGRGRTLSPRRAGRLEKRPTARRWFRGR